MTAAAARTAPWMIKAIRQPARPPAATTARTAASRGSSAETADWSRDQSIRIRARSVAGVI